MREKDSGDDIKSRLTRFGFIRQMARKKIDEAVMIKR